MDNRPIGMFDSGVGGLTVFAEVKKKNPKEQIIYLGDTKRFPYGSKSKESIIEISRQCVDFLIKQNVKAIIIACGTATSQALEILQQEYAIPIIGIIEPTILDLKQRKTKGTIGIIATKGTIRSDAWRKSLSEQLDGIEVINKETPLLASMAECGWTDNKVAEETIHEYMKELRKIDKLILGCTHYPLFTPLIRKELGDQVEIINTGEKLAEYLRSFLQNNNLASQEEKEDNIYLTDMEESFIETANVFLPNKKVIQNIQKLTLGEK